MGAEIDTASNGEEALTKLKGREFGLILLDIRMPGMDGMEILRRVREIRPDIRVIMITAFGTIESAVAIKLGAVDFLQKPFGPEEIRELVSRVADRDRLDEHKQLDYASFIECAKKCIGERHFDAAIKHVHRGISVDPGRPEAFNLLGALMEMKGDRIEAQKNYRAALSLDPSYQPAVAIFIDQPRQNGSTREESFMRITKETKTVAELVLIHVRNRSFGIGEPTVHVLHLDIALDAMRLLCYDRIRLYKPHFSRIS